MSDISVNIYRVIAAIAVVLLFFITGRPFFSAKGRIFMSAVVAGVLNAFAAGALLGTSLSGIPLRFVVAFVGIGAGVALLEYLFPEGGTRMRLKRQG